MSNSIAPSVSEIGAPIAHQDLRTRAIAGDFGIAPYGVVAIVPFWSQSDNLNNDSSYSYLRTFLPALAQRSPRTIWIVFFPDPSYGADRWRYKDDGFQTDRIRFVPWPYDSAMRSSVLGFDPLRFKQIEERYAPSIYWLIQPEMGPFVMGGYKGSFSISNRPTIVAQHHYVIHESLPYPIEGLFPRRWLQLGGSFAADAILYPSAHARALADAANAAILGPSALDELARKTRVIPFGLLTGDEPVAGAPDGPPVVLYNHRFEAYKQPDVTFAVLRDLRAQGHRFPIWATQASGQMTADYPIDRAIHAPARADYLRAIAVPGINTINSVHETFCIAALDSLAVGQILVAPRAVTFPELVPQDYPYLFSSVAEQAAMLATILADWPAAHHAWSARLAAHARATFGRDRYADAYHELFGRIEMSHLQGPLRPTTTVALDRLFGSLPVDTPVPPTRLATILNSGKLGAKLGAQAMGMRRIVREAIKRDDIDLTLADGVRIIRRSR